ncbi:transcription factor bHLH95-like isoform X2 [Nicotiana tomentosiformis]|uniref:Transcription factor bHLH95-like isoform X2 n=1 Tax=Nicotiana tabacum TaxID=4097 RepID=A0A1S4A933_TOBAC|nr:PREDICTED: transcription factor bHLH95-like isoform X2 [Nicotiana tabacum]XP_033513420.1 transcription factor bHLH95-like isoform X2 [Nicotiana tomentosiformis]
MRLDFTFYSLSFSGPIFVLPNCKLNLFLNMDEGGEDCFIWENQGWAFLNSDNSGGNGAKSSGTKLPDTSHGKQLAISDAVAREIEMPGPSAGRKRTAPGKNGVKGNGEVNEGKVNGGESDHEMHIWTERERRKKMRNMFSNLHALLPQLPPKADKSTIVDEAVNYIKTLEHTLEKLQRQKLERLHGMATSIITSQKLSADSIISREEFLADQGSTNNAAIRPTNNAANPISMPAAFQTWTSPNVILNVFGEEAHISVCCPRKPGLLSSICYVLEKHKIEVVSAQISSNDHRSMYMIQAHASGASDQFSETFLVEEIYKQAAGEIILCVTSQ